MKRSQQLHRIAYAAAMALGSMGQGGCALAQPAAPMNPDTAVSNANADAHASDQRFWYDGDQRRTLRIDPDWVADFRGSKPEFERRETSARGTKSSEPVPGVSPVLRDESGDPRALPGGVIVRLRDADLADPRQALIDAGLEPVRAIDPQQRTWLVASAAGLASLELANRLHESGRFASVTPNWWRERALK